MNFSALVAQVYTITGRSDLTEETKTAVRASILKMHGLDFFYRDLWITKVQFPSAEYIQKFDTSQLPRYRNTGVIRKWDNTYNVQELNPLYSPRLDASGLTIFKSIEPSNIFDEQYTTTLKKDVYYAAGSAIYMRSLIAFDVILLGYYSFPDVTEDEFETWLMQNHPYAVIFDAASTIFQTIGQQDVSRKYDDPNGGLIAQQINQIRMANTVAYAS